MRDDPNFLFMAKLLDEQGIRSTKEFISDISAIITSNKSKFIEFFTTNILNADMLLQKYEKLNLKPNQKRSIFNNLLYRLEYRKDKLNIKCIFIVEKNNNNKIINLCAFSEKNDKSKGKYTYKDNIERAIRIYLKWKVNYNE